MTVPKCPECGHWNYHRVACSRRVLCPFCGADSRPHDEYTAVSSDTRIASRTVVLCRCKQGVWVSLSPIESVLVDVAGRWFRVEPSPEVEVLLAP